MIGIFPIELGFVHYVERRVRRDAAFAASAQATRPAIWIWYSIISGALLIAGMVSALVP